MDDSYERMFKVDDESVMLNMFELASLQPFTALANLYIRTLEGFMLVYSTTSRSSFEEVRIVQRKILAVKGKARCPMVLIGNHCTRATEREVDLVEGENLAREFGCRFVEIDHEKSINVTRAFEDLVRELREHEKAESVTGLTMLSAENSPHSVKRQGWRQALAAFTSRWNLKRKA